LALFLQQQGAIFGTISFSTYPSACSNGVRGGRLDGLAGNRAKMSETSVYLFIFWGICFQVPFSRGFHH